MFLLLSKTAAVRVIFFWFLEPCSSVQREVELKIVLRIMLSEVVIGSKLWVHREGVVTQRTTIGSHEKMWKRIRLFREETSSTHIKRGFTPIEAKRKYNIYSATVHLKCLGVVN
jgi:hypothetical protein